MSSNVISLPRYFQNKSNGLSSLVESFANHRRNQSDVFWLKENAELLSIFECTGAPVSEQDLQSYHAFYQSLPDRITFFPQYYRFLTSIALDLEAMGFEGDIGAQMCQFVDRNGLDQAELSDLQRGEAMRLLARRDIQRHSAQELRARLHAFMDHAPSFALPNRKLAYELTHIVFYLSEYGRRDPDLSAQACQSLMFTGIIAHLEQNADLLAEVCVALRYAGRVPPVVWETWITQVVNGFDRVAQVDGGGDHYHEYLVVNWACAQMGGAAFKGPYGNRGQGLYSPVMSLGALGALSETLFAWRGARRASWGAMEQAVLAALPCEIAAHLRDVVAATDEFDAFFAHFARAPEHKVPVQALPKVAQLERIQ